MGVWFPETYHLQAKKRRTQNLWRLKSYRAYCRCRSRPKLGHTCIDILERASHFFEIDREMAEVFALEYCTNTSSLKSCEARLGWGWLKNGKWTYSPPAFQQVIWARDETPKHKYSMLWERPKNYRTIAIKAAIKEELQELNNAKNTLKRAISARSAQISSQGHD